MRLYVLLKSAATPSSWSYFKKKANVAIGRRRYAQDDPNPLDT